MDIGSIFLLTIFVFAIAYFAVRLAITPLLYKQDESISYKQDFGLVKLRDIDVLSPAELEEVIRLYYKKGAKKEDYEQYQKYAKVLNELREMNFFTDDVYLCRMNILKDYFNIN